MSRRITPFDVPSQTEMILHSLYREKIEQEKVRYTGYEKGVLLKDFAKVITTDSMLTVNESVLRFMLEAASTALGPFGGDKMVIKDLGKYPTTRHVFLTNDLYEFLNHLEFEHPVAKMFFDLAMTVESEVGDGVATTIVLASSLSIKGLELVRLGLHPTVVINGLDLGLKLSLEYLDRNSVRVDINDTGALQAITTTAIRNKVASELQEDVSKTVVEMFSRIIRSELRRIDFITLKVERTIGQSLRDSTFLNGVILRNEVIDREMPKSIWNARVAIISKPIVTRDFRKPIRYDEVVYEFEETSAYRSYSNARRTILNDAADRIIASGANALFCEGIDEVVIERLKRCGILAVRRLVPEDMERIARATGATIVPSPDQLSPEYLGYARSIQEKEVGDSKFIFVESGLNNSPQSVLIVAPYDEIARDAEHAILNSLRSLETLRNDARVVAGGGIALLGAAMHLRNKAIETGSKVSLVLDAFADALEDIHKCIVSNAGYQPIDVIAEVKHMHHEGKLNYGFDVVSGEFKDFILSGIVDPIYVVKQALISAVTLAKSVIKTDCVYYIPRTRRELIEKRKKERVLKGKGPGDWVEEKEY